MKVVIYLEEEDWEKCKDLNMEKLIELLPKLVDISNVSIIGRNKGGHFKRLEVKQK